LQYPQIEAVALLLVLALFGCESRREGGDSAASVRHPAPAASSATSTTAAAASDAPSGGEVEKSGETRATSLPHRAARCGECHEKMYREWRESPHAHTGDSALYQALRKANDASCERCHEPLRALGGSVEFARSEGVTCDVCHRVDRVTVYPGHAEAPLEGAHRTKYGPRCDPKRPYFHKAECRPIYEKSEFCAACHLLALPDAAGQLVAIHSEYKDWLAGPYPGEGKTCQSCHMLPGVEAELAVGESLRDGVPDHGFWGRDANLRGTALTAHAQASWKGDTVVIEVKVTNARAGHFIPAGAPGQQVVLRVTPLSATGEEMSREERIFERRGLAAQGAAASLFTSSTTLVDTRIGALQTRHERFELNVPEASQARIALLRRTDPELSRRFGIDGSSEQPISSVALPLSSSDGARRVSSRLMTLVR
jgi:hypothetical protein